MCENLTKCNFVFTILFWSNWCNFFPQTLLSLLVAENEYLNWSNSWFHQLAKPLLCFSNLIRERSKQPFHDSKAYTELDEVDTLLQALMFTRDYPRDTSQLPDGSVNYWNQDQVKYCLLERLLTLIKYKIKLIDVIALGVLDNREMIRWHSVTAFTFNWSLNEPIESWIVCWFLNYSQTSVSYLPFEAKNI